MPIKKALVLGRKLTAAEADANFNWLTGSPGSATIAGGIITVDGADWYRIDTEGGTASDNLDRINGTTEGAIVQLYLVNASHKVIVKHGTYLRLINGSDFVMDSLYDSIIFRSFGSDLLVEMPGGRASVI